MTLPHYYIDGDILPGAAVALSEFLAKHSGPVTVYINSPGGVASEGAAMMAAIAAHGGVTVRVRGVAASAATLPMVAAHRALIDPAAMVMIHEPSALAEGTADGHRAAAGALDKITSTYARAYAHHTGHPVETILAWMHAETWMTAEEAVALRFADALDDTAEAPQIAARADYTRFKAAPEALRRLAARHGWTADPSEPPKEQAHA